jgi:Ca-activated chloride channel family protein
MPRAVLAAALVLGLIGPVSGRQPRTTFRAGTELVHVGVTVTDRKGHIVPGLTAEDFELLEDGRPQTIAYFAQAGDAGAPELHVGLMLDTSESMAADLQTSQTAAIKFLNRLPDAADLTLVDFATEVRIGRFSQDDFPRLVERIRTREVEGWTALYDAFALYLHRAAEDPGRTVLVAFTDGGDSRSTIDFADALSAVRASAATIYVVGFLEHQSSSSRNLQRLRLQQLAAEAGGLAIFPLSMREIERAYDTIVDEIHGQYSLGYVSTNARRDGRWRRIEVRLRPGGKDLRVRTRGGYYAPVDAAGESR